MAIERTGLLCQEGFIKIEKKDIVVNNDCVTIGEAQYEDTEIPCQCEGSYTILSRYTCEDGIWKVYKKDVQIIDGVEFIGPEYYQHDAGCCNGSGGGSGSGSGSGSGGFLPCDPSGCPSYGSCEEGDTVPVGVNYCCQISSTNIPQGNNCLTIQGSTLSAAANVLICNRSTAGVMRVKLYLANDCNGTPEWDETINAGDCACHNWTYNQTRTIEILWVSGTDPIDYSIKVDGGSCS